MTKIRIAIVALLVSTLFLSACGRRGPLEPPPDLEKQDKKDKGFALDPLI
jgi:predicted small lipoprotein YifL